MRNSQVEGAVNIARIVLKLRNSVGEHSDVLGLATTSRSYKHETMTHLASVVKLDDLLHEDWHINYFFVFDRCEN